ncbi:MAG: glycosyltransferase family 2 protein [Chitinophagaceae bacterium]|nr:MAG: glycosyltransferase family 2 protein [Chitinophagaceae bacterium]
MISVLIPTYNYAHFLDETIQSVLNQSFTDFELIVVDNHSTDNTTEVVEKYLTDPRVSYYRNETNLGLVGNWNMCLRYPKAEYIKFICADDKIHPEMLDKFYAVMELYPNVSLITCDKQLFDGQPWVVELPLKHLQQGKKVIFDTMTSKSWIGEPTSVMFRKSNLSLGTFRNDYTLHVDWEMWNRQLTVGDCYIIPEALAYIRAHASQHTRAVSSKACFEEYYMAKLMYDYQGFDNAEDKVQIRRIVREKAAQCAKKAMYKQIPKITNKKSRETFFKALSITAREGVFLKGLGLLWNGFQTKTKKRLLKTAMLIPVTMVSTIIQSEDIPVSVISLFVK